MRHGRQTLRVMARSSDRAAHPGRRSAPRHHCCRAAGNPWLRDGCPEPVAMPLVSRLMPTPRKERSAGSSLGTGSPAWPSAFGLAPPCTPVPGAHPERSGQPSPACASPPRRPAPPPTLTRSPASQHTTRATPPRSDPTASDPDDLPSAARRPATTPGPHAPP